MEAKIIAQAEFYLSEDYLMKNAYLLRQVFLEPSSKVKFFVFQKKTFYRLFYYEFSVTSVRQVLWHEFI